MILFILKKKIRNTKIEKKKRKNNKARYFIPRQKGFVDARFKNKKIIEKLPCTEFENLKS